MLVDIHADHAAAAVQHLVQIIVHDKAEVGLAAGAVEQHDLLAVVLLKHGRDQLDIVVDLVVFADHVVFELAVCGQDADLPQQGRCLIDTDQVLPPAVQQGVRGRGLFLCRGFALGLLHLHPARRNRQGHDRTALGIGQHRFVKLLRLLGEKRAETGGIHLARASLKAQRIALFCSRQLRIEFLFARGERADCLHEKVPVFGQARRNTAEQQLQLRRISFLHHVSQPLLQYTIIKRCNLANLSARFYRKTAARRRLRCYINKNV